MTDLEKQVSDRDRELAGLRGDLSTEMAKLKEAQRGLIRALRPQIEKGNIMVDLNNERLLINLASGFKRRPTQISRRGCPQAGGNNFETVPGIPSQCRRAHRQSADQKRAEEKIPLQQRALRSARANAALALGEGGLSAVTTHGYADTRPMMPNTTDAGRAKNRRVEVRVTK